MKGHLAIALLGALGLAVGVFATPVVAQVSTSRAALSPAVDRLLNAHHIDPGWLTTWTPTAADVEGLLAVLHRAETMRHRNRAAAALALAPLDDRRVDARLEAILAPQMGPELAEPNALQRHAASTLILRAQRRGQLQALVRRMVQSPNAIVREEAIRRAGEDHATPAADVLIWAEGSPRLEAIAHRAIARRRQSRPASSTHVQR